MAEKKPKDAKVVKSPKVVKNPPLGYHPAPKTLPGFPKAKPVKPKTGMGGGKKRKRWKNDDGDILEWDYQHGKIERYNDKGKHKGEFDPDTGKETKAADPKRTVTPTIWTKEKVKMIYYLTWFDKDSDDYMGETLMPGVGEDDVRKVFGLEPEEPPGDCLEVEREHVEWLGQVVKGVHVSLDVFDYFVEACQP
jgi:hypothetical protein